MTKFTDALPAQSATPGLSHQKSFPQSKKEISLMLRRLHDDQREARTMLLNFVQTFYNGQAILDDLTSITTAATGDLLRFNGTKWVDYPDSNYQPQDAALDDLTAISTAALGDLLRFDGTNWVDYADSNFAASSHNHAGADINSGTLPDARIQASGVTQHEAALALTAAQTTSLTFADARIAESNITQHQAALGLTAAQTTSLTFADARIAVSNVTQHQGSISQLAAHVGLGGVTSSEAAIKDVSGTLAARNGDDTANAPFSADDITSGGNYKRTVTTAITASTTQTQGQQALTSDFNHVSVVANANDVVTLPTAATGMMITVYNAGANTLQIFPASGDQVDANSIDTSVSLATLTTGMFWASTTTVWLSVGELGRVTA